jgi:hypothetical protein
MDPASVIGLVAAVAQLLDQGASVFKFASGLYKDVKDAPTQAAKLVYEMTTMIGVVTSLKLTLDTFPETLPVSQQKPLTTSIEKLLEILQEMEKKCDPKQMTAFGRLKWPFQEKKTNEYIERIQRYRGILGIALQQEQMFNPVCF